QAPALGPLVRQTRIVGNPERDGYERWIDIGVRRRPSRTLPDSKKGKDYDGECAAYYLSRVRSTMMDTFRSEYATNTAYTIGQWGEEEDVRVFLKDNGKSFSKVKFTYP